MLTLAWESVLQANGMRIATPTCGLVRNDSRFFYALLLAEGLAVGALVSSGIDLMGTNQNALQRAEVGILAVMLALLNSTLNALVCMTIHSVSPPSSRDEIRLPPCVKNIHFIYADD